MRSADPSTAAAIARQISTLRPLQLPESASVARPVRSTLPQRTTLRSFTRLITEPASAEEIEQQKPNRVRKTNRKRMNYPQGM
ncbi:hypothetical protein GTQ43_21515 [Nostoc sp. KVJ3]|uniref:hypothetical protein n=1 Tax=Nostoc sp. KVJ3 TaxID=457945 RepID=UPI0022387734|nr:hypothetical protein [Nostoc sp. KVJ3]MCW5316300.1 hypothetical protein [Nostoc sp. KVJ3]